MIIDAHAHIFKKINGNVNKGRTLGLGYGKVLVGNEILSMMPPLNKKTEHTAQMLIENMDMAGVEKAVLLQGPFYGNCNTYVAKAVQKFKGRLAAAYFFDPWRKNAKKNFIRMAKNECFSAIKIECSEETCFFGIHKDISPK